MATALRTEDPAVASAMGRCLTARSLRTGTEPFRPTVRHPRPCGWCDYPAEELEVAVIEFNNWAMFNDRLGTSGRHSTRIFAHELSPEAREAAIVAAQAFVEPGPMPPPQPPAPVVEEPMHPEEEASPWRQ